MSDGRVQQGPVQDQGYGEDPLFFYTRIFCRFFQLVFASFDPGQYKWLDDENNTEIFVADASSISREVIEKRPAILVSRSAFQFGNLSFNQFVGPNFEKASQKKFSDLNSGAMALRCISKVETEASRIAHTCAMACRRLKAPLMRAGRIHRVAEEIVISEATPPGTLVQPEAPPETVVVTVTIPFYYQDRWSIEPADKLLLKRIDLVLRSELNYPAPGAAVINAPSMNGKPLKYDKVLSLTERVHVTGKGPKPRG